MEKICKNCRHRWLNQPYTQTTNEDICANAKTIKVVKDEDTCAHFAPIQEDNKEER